MKYIYTVLTLANVLLFTTANATVWYVHPDSAMNCIQHCLDSCSTGDTVLVGPGVYSEHIAWPSTHGIDLVSEYGVDMTYIDGDTTDRVVSITVPVDTTTRISGLTIQNGYAEYGAGILCTNGASPLIASNTISLNTSFGDGGAGICLVNASPVISDNIIEQNSAGNGAGGGIALAGSSNPLIASNTIKNNTCDMGGGGILVFVDCSPTISANDIDSNTAFSGGAIALQTSSASVRNNNITGNNAERGGGLYFTQYDSSIVTSNTITGNTAGSGGGISCKSGSVTSITYCTIKNNNGDGVYCWEDGNPLINYNNIEDNVGYGVRNVSYILINAENNWWGDASGPYHPSTNPSGLGSIVSDYVDFNPWLTNPGVEEYKPAAPLVLNLQVTPNPFTQITDIRYQITDNGTRNSMKDAGIRIYDASGRLVKDFGLISVIGYQSSVRWYGDDNAGRKLPSGTYFLVLQTGEYSTASKLLLIR